MSRLSIPACAAGLALAVAFIGGPRLYDDTYITLRYARSIVEGQGFVFNPGEPVLGTTTPLLTLALAALHAVSGVELATLVFVLAAAGHVATAVLLVLIGRGCGFEAAAGLAAATYAVAPLVSGPVLGGMEASIFTAAALAALMPWKTERLSQSLLAATAVLLRPEGLIVVGLRLLASLNQGIRQTKRATLTMAALILPWVVFATWYFGDPIPQSLKAKWAAAAGHTAPWSVAEMFLYVLLRLPFGADMPAAGLMPRSSFGLQIASLLPFPSNLEARYALVLVSAVADCTLLVIGAREFYRRCRRMIWLLLFAALYVAAYGIFQPAMFQWYLVPPLPLLALTLFVGVQSLVDRVPDVRWRQLIRAGLGIVVMGCAAYQLRQLARRSPSLREPAYQRAVAALGAVGQQPSTVIGAMEIGAVGYATHARVIDYYGLVSLGLDGRGIEPMLDRYHPDYFIIHALLARFEGVLSNRRFLESYHKLTSIDASAGLVHAEIEVWQRNDGEDFGARR